MPVSASAATCWPATGNRKPPGRIRASPHHWAALARSTGRFAAGLLTYIFHNEDRPPPVTAPPDPGCQACQAVQELRDGGGLGVRAGRVMALEKGRRDLGELVGAIPEAGITVFAVIAQVVHDGQGVPLVWSGESDGVGDPDAVRGPGVLFPAVLVAGLVLWPGPPDSPLLIDGADVLEPVDEIAPDAGGGLGEDVVDQVVEVLRGGVDVAPVGRRGEVGASHAESADAVGEAGVFVAVPQVVGVVVVTGVERAEHRAAVGRGELDAASAVAEQQVSHHGQLDGGGGRVLHAGVGVGPPSE